MTNMAQRIRAYLVQHGEVSPYDFYKAFNKRYPYQTVIMYFYILEHLGLIEVSREETNMKNSPVKKIYYSMVPGREYDQCWNYPWQCYWDETGKEKFISTTYKVLGVYPWRKKD